MYQQSFSARGPQALRLIALLLSLSILSACGGVPKEVDRDGLRDRADQETDQVK